MNVLVLNAPFFPKFSRPQRSPAVTKSGTLYYPIWLAYAVGVLEAEGHTVLFLDAPAAGLTLEDVMARARAHRPRLVVIDTTTPSIAADIEAAETIKTALPDTVILLVGTHASALPEATLQLSAAVDLLALREYDHTVRDVAAAVDADSRDWSGIPGLMIRQDGALRRTAEREMIMDLDALPMVSAVYRKHLQPQHYFNPNAKFPNVTLISGRGCPYQCSFCVYPQTMSGHRYRIRSIPNVLAELDYVLKEFPEMQEIFFEDDTLTGNKPHCRALCEAMIARGLRLGWVANSRADLDYETMVLMHKAGCRELCVGFESGNQEVLDAIHKKMTVASERRFMQDARRAGILIHGCFMVGFPGETRAGMEQTLALALELAPDTAQFYPVMVYPGTRAYEQFRMDGLLTTEDYTRWLTPDGLHNCVTRTGTMGPEDLVRFCDEARRKFYLRPRYWFFKAGQLLRHPSEIGRTAKAARTFIRYLVRGSFAPTPVPARRTA